MSDKRVTIRLPKELFELLRRGVFATLDLTGLKAISTNTWLILAIKEKLDRDKK